MPFGIIHPSIFCAAVLLLNLAPGPDTAYIVGRSVSQGRRAGILSALGVSLGCCVHTLFCALGLTALLAASANAFTVVRFGGAIYLAWLGWRMIRRARPMEATTARETRPVVTQPLRGLVALGFVTNVLNPKVILFFLSFFPQFVATNSIHKPAAFLVLGLVFVGMSTVHNSSVAWLAGSITQRLRRAPRAKVWLERSVGAAFIALGIRLVIGRWGPQV
jgi:threonine/homoserine/homoserine lactone efflux protein